MRLDKFLKVSRIIKRRTVANDACDASHVSVNGRVVKASYDVKVGDEISVSFGARKVTVRVLAVKETVKKEDAVHLYEVISET
jgi:ribosomal 50S subunit-recycling heat shock protein